MRALFVPVLVNAVRGMRGAFAAQPRGVSGRFARPFAARCAAALPRRGVADGGRGAAGVRQEMDGGEKEEEEEENLFALLGLAPMFPLSRRELQLRVRELQKEHHPDVRRGSEDISAKVNAAFDTLAPPHRRAEYLLRLGGVIIDEGGGEEDGGDGWRGGGEQGLVLDVFERRMALQQALGDEAALRAMVAELDALIEKHGDAFHTAYPSPPAGNAAWEGDLQAAVNAAVALQYYCSLRDEVEARLPHDE